MMAWSIPIYNGLYALGNPSRLRTGLFELCRAVNERETALGWVDDGVGFGGNYGQLTRFYKADGTTGVNLTMDDLEKLPCSGVGSYAYVNMCLINGFCANRCHLFTAGESTTPYTKASLEAAIGTTLDNPLRYNEARWWQSVQDALDLLRYPWGFMLNDSSTSPDLGYSNNYSTIAAAWAARYDNTYTFGPGALSAGGWVSWQSFGQWAATVKTSWTDRFKHDYVTYDYPASLYFAPVGSVHATKIIYSAGAYGLAGACDFTIDGTTVSVSAPVSSTEIAVTPFSLVSDSYVTVDFDEPSSSPFDVAGDPFTDHDQRLVALALDSFAKVYWDITAELTDQA